MRPCAPCVCSIALLACGRTPTLIPDGGAHDFVSQPAPQCRLAAQLGFGASSHITPESDCACLSAATADLDGNGALDLVSAGWANQGVNVRVQLGRGDGTFGPPTAFGADFSPGAGPAQDLGMATGDVNSDGLVDVAFLSARNMGVLLGRTGGALKSGQTYGFDAMPADVVLADFNGDGKLDAAVTVPARGKVFLFVGQGNGDFQPPSVLTMGGTPRRLVAGDWNGDGASDLAVKADGAVVVFLGNGNGTFRQASPILVGSSQGGIAAGDVNGDGRPDLVATDGPNDLIAVLTGRGDGTFTAPAILSFGFLHPRAPAIADFNCDGHPDIAFSDSDDSRAHILLGRPQGGFDTGTFDFPRSDATQTGAALIVGDWNGDGRADLALGSNLGVSVFFNHSQ